MLKLKVDFCACVENPKFCVVRESSAIEPMLRQVKKTRSAIALCTNETSIRSRSMFTIKGRNVQSRRWRRNREQHIYVAKLNLAVLA